MKFSFFQVSLHFPIFFKILKFHISMTGKAADTFPGAVGTLYRAAILQLIWQGHFQVSVYSSNFFQFLQVTKIVQSRSYEIEIRFQEIIPIWFCSFPFQIISKFSSQCGNSSYHLYVKIDADNPAPPPMGFGQFLLVLGSLFFPFYIYVHMVSNMHKEKYFDILIRSYAPCPIIRIQ